MIGILVYIGIVLLTYLAGDLLLRIFRLKFDQVSKILISFGLGIGIIIYINFILGLLGLIKKEIYIALLILLIIINKQSMFDLLRQIKKLSIFISKQISFNIKGLMWLILIFTILINALPIFTPIVEFDSTSYHLTFAKIYAQGSFEHIPSHIYSAMPHAMSLVYVLPELFLTPNVSNAIVYTLTILSAMGIYYLIRQKHSNTAALSGSLLYLITPAVLERISQTMIDLVVAFYIITVIIILYHYTKENQAKHIALIGILIGIAASIKLTAAAPGIAIGIGIILSWIIYKQKIKISHLIILGIIVLLIISPWIIRSYILTGNPIYPQGYSIFGGEYLAPNLEDAYSSHFELKGISRSLVNIITVPIQMTFRSTALDSPLGIHPLFILLIPLFFIYNKTMKEKKFWILLAIITYLILMIVFYVHPILRYMFAGIALMSVISAMTLDSIPKKVKVIAFILIIVASLFSTLLWGGINIKNINYLVNSESDSEYYAKLSDQNPYNAMRWINENTAKDSKILLFNEVRGYFLDREYILSQKHQTFIDYENMNNKEDLMKRLTELEINYILIHKSFVTNTDHAKELIDSVNTDSELVYDDESVSVYRV